MKKNNKKMLKTLAIVLSLFFVLLLFCCFFKTIGPEANIEKQYLSSKSNEDLFTLSNSLLQTENYKKIVKYYPSLFEISELKTLILNSNAHEKDIETLGLDNVLNLYVFTYLDAIFETEGLEKFNEKFNEYCHLIVFTEENNEIKTLDSLQIFFFNTLGRYYSGINEDKVSAFLYQIENLWSAKTHLEHYNNYFYGFCFEWYAKINEYDISKNMYMKISKEYISVLENEIVLQNNYRIGVSSNYGHNIVCIKGYSVSFFPELTEEVTHYLLSDNYLVVKCSNGGFYIFDTEKNVKTTFLSEGEYALKAAEYGFKDVELKSVNVN